MTELYDYGCDLVEAAAAIRRAAAARTAPGAPAAVGCIQAALEQLAEATATLWVTIDEAIGEASPGDVERVEAARARTHQGFINLHAALTDAHASAAAARGLAGRVLAHAGVTT